MSFPSSVAKPFVVRSNGMIVFRVKGYNVRGYQHRIHENFLFSVLDDSNS